MTSDVHQGLLLKSRGLLPQPIQPKQASAKMSPGNTQKVTGAGAVGMLCILRFHRGSTAKTKDQSEVAMGEGAHCSARAIIMSENNFAGPFCLKELTGRLCQPLTSAAA